MSIKDDLEAVAREMLADAHLPVRPREIFCTARQAIEMYRRGWLVPGDRSVRVFVPAGEAEGLRAFLATFGGAE